MELWSDGIRLHAVLDMPESHPAACPLVIVVHGFTGNMEETHLRAVSAELNALGYATLRVDLYGHGQSGGDFQHHTLLKWVDNLLTVIDVALELTFVTSLYLCGHSQGGLAVMLAAALKHDVISGLMVLSPAVTIPQMARQGCFRGIPFDPVRIPAQIMDAKGRVICGNYLRVAQMIDVEKALACYSGPVLWVHGTQDRSIPLQDVQELALSYEHISFVVIQGAPHGYQGHLEQVTAAIGTWLTEGPGTRR